MHFLLVFVVFYGGYVESVCWVQEMENSKLFQGDIQIDLKEKEESNGYASIVGGRWPNNIVPYHISNMNINDHQSIMNAIDDYHKFTCLKFVKRSKENTYLNFFVGEGCSSPVGYKDGRVNNVSLANGCLGHGTILHEIGHSIGLFHEQSRPDRDNFITIHWGYIPTKMRFNFLKQTQRSVDSLGTPYDYESIMHYGQTAFGNGRITITTTDPSKQNVIGNRNGFSKIDIQQINAMYNCK